MSTNVVSRRESLDGGRAHPKYCLPPAGVQRRYMCNMGRPTVGSLVEKKPSRLSTGHRDCPCHSDMSISDKDPRQGSSRIINMAWPVERWRGLFSTGLPTVGLSLCRKPIFVASESLLPRHLFRSLHPIVSQLCDDVPTLKSHRVYLDSLRVDQL